MDWLVSNLIPPVFFARVSLARAVLRQTTLRIERR